MTDVFIHPTAVVDGVDIQIGSGSKIWHFTHVMPGARIGARCSIGHGCFIANVRIGDGCRIQNHVSIFEGVTLEDDVFVGPSCAFTNVRHPRAHVARRDRFEATLVCKGASIGANATVLSGVTVGSYALVGAGAVVTRDVPAYAIVVGSPARRIGWACRCGDTLPELLTCNRCGDQYVEHVGELARSM